MRCRLPLVFAVAAASLAPSCSEEPTAACSPRAVDPSEPHVFRSGGEERRYQLAIPDADPGPEGLPLVVSLHGHGSSAAEHEANTSLAGQGAQRGFVVVTPDALGDPRRWNFDLRADGPDDYTFVAELVDDLVRRACVDPDRTYVAGSSNGAAFAGLLACTGSAHVTAVAMVIATVPSTCPDDITPSVLTIRGTADTTVPYAGTPEVVATWVEHDVCTAPPREDEPHPGVTRITYDECSGGGQVVLATVDGGTHAWPGGVRADRPGNSAAGIDYSATDEILAFFTRGEPS
jgi:polyhydroxybutyrate depolymerase